ncbi:MAG: hypothetical protein U9N34_04000, partial [Candidatus Cloacimonadota bacterium]|nr:hypothetical protein [Candidatus Cloacimonadota bacterium]
IGLFATLENNDTKVILINKSYKFQGKINQTVSLIPFSKQVDGIYTKGLKFRLANETLYRNQTRGISNVLTKKQVEINLTKGKLLIILMKGN